MVDGFVHITHNQFPPVCLAVRCQKPLSGFGPRLLWVVEKVVWWPGFPLPLQLIRGSVTRTPPITYVCLGLWISCWHCQDTGTEEKAFWQWLQHPTDRQRWSLEGHLCLNWLGSWAWHVFSDSKYFRLCGTYRLFGTIQLCCVVWRQPWTVYMDLGIVCQTLIEPTQWPWELSYLICAQIHFLRLGKIGLFFLSSGDYSSLQTP